ncbi:hypothetical protein [Sphingobacterium sp. MYb382]|uniref:hypothetical protein n=1 Tax=Sphingobacterium sp. MYb382 TaxID=2745278 RepID=UPI0030B5F5D3
MKFGYFGAMKISAEADVVKAIKEALETNLYTQGIASRCEVVITDKGVEFIPKEELTAKDWFWLGYFVREYID